MKNLNVENWDPFTSSISVDASDTVLNENNGVAPKWCCIQFPSDSIIFKENGTTSIIAELSQR